jgi:hypothetical protein
MKPYHISILEALSPHDNHPAYVAEIDTILFLSASIKCILELYASKIIAAGSFLESLFPQQ